MREVEREADKVRSELKTKADAEPTSSACARRSARASARCPRRRRSNARVTGVVERDAYKIEKVIFESRPGFLVTANLYVPKGRKFPLPGVVGTCGHSANGKAAEAYQSFAQGLARMGYVVLIFDPLGQGERLAVSRREAQAAASASASASTCTPATSSSWSASSSARGGRGTASARSTTCSRREEVDPRHVGVTGNSGGGTMTTWLCGVEQRWTMAAPSCFVTTFRRNLENELPADTEQCPPRALALGLDHGDFLAAMAPKPVIILAKEKDYFDVRGARRPTRG